jgi:eukaryotic-like serine/threonine-protein kinase
MNFQVGQSFGDYTITAVVGAASVGQIYAVRHQPTNRIEAMKVLASDLATETQVTRFEREMRVLASLTHPNIAAFHDSLYSENHLMLLMEYVEGDTLEKLLKSGRLAVETGVDYIKQALSALRYAHDKGVVHRDVTPANLIITTSGQVKLTDFGISKSFGDPLLTNFGDVLGSLSYMAPEQVKGATQPNPRSDLYSVGVILYEILTGTKPFGANRRLAGVVTDSESEPSPPTDIEPRLSPQWNKIISRALAKYPDNRYQSANEFIDAIVQVHQQPKFELPFPKVRASGIGIAVLAGLVLASGALMKFHSFGQVPQPAVAWQRLHIAPPASALAIQPAPLPVLKKPEGSSGQAIQAHQSKVPVLAAHPTGSPSLTVRQMTPLSSPPSKAAPASETAPGPSPKLEQPVVEAPVAQQFESPIAPPPPPEDQPAPEAKKKFWSKINPFKKKHKTAPAVEGSKDQSPPNQ